MPRSPVKRLPYSELFEDTIAGFDSQLEYFRGAPYPPLTIVPLTNDTQLMETARKQNSDKLKFPFFARRLTSVEERSDQMNGFLLRMEGLSRKDNAGNWYQFRLMPIKITFTVNFVCQDQQQLHLFAQRWLDCSRLHYLDFDLEYFDNVIKIKTNCDNNISMPDISTDDTGSMYNAETSVNLDCFCGSITPVAAIRQLNQSTSFKSTILGGQVPFQTNVYKPEPDGLYRNGEKIRSKP